MVVANEAKLDLGNGHELTFIMAPNLHWPDTIFTHDAKTNTLFTCDAFGMHYCSEEVFDPSMDKIMEHYSFYYECLMKANARSVSYLKYDPTITLTPAQKSHQSLRILPVPIIKC
eukprot:8536316-Pyramimonas_sp.AAC.1